MKEDISKIIHMVQEGKIEAEEAEELIHLLKEKSSTVSDDSYLGKMLKVRIQSGMKEKVNVNIPIRFVKALLKIGKGIASNIPEAREYMDDMDMDVIMEAIDQNMDGKIIDMETEDGDKVSVSIE